MSITEDGAPPVAAAPRLFKAPTGIQGFDEITGGGLPRGRTTLICGGAGCGKTLFGVEFLVRGALHFDEPGVFVSFEESVEELVANAASLGLSLRDLTAQRKLSIDHVQVERSEIEETGEYDLEGLFLRLGYAIDSIGARRVVLDTIEALFAALPNEGILRAELRRLFRWLKDRGVTAIITGERGAGTLSRHGLEEYVSDCVILLDQRVHNRVATRQLRVVKYRGSSHGTNEYPFLIGERGISVLPITSLGLEHEVSTERISLGIPRLDNMLGGTGVYRGSSILVSGAAGAGKTSIAASAVAAACRRGERCIYFSFEESRSQFVRNMRSIGLDLEGWGERGLLQFRAVRPTLFGLEMHLATMHALIESFAPSVVVIDPISSFVSASSAPEVWSMLMRLIDFLKSRQITLLMTNLTSDDESREHTDVGVSSLIDSWILLRMVDSCGERNRCLYVLKSRGMAHSNQVREFVMSERGIELTDVYAGPGGVLTGAARHAQEARESLEALERRQRIERKQRELERRRHALESQIQVLRAEFDTDTQELEQLIAQEELRERATLEDRGDMVRIRQSDALREAAVNVSHAPETWREVQ